MNGTIRWGSCMGGSRNWNLILHQPKKVRQRHGKGDLSRDIQRRLGRGGSKEILKSSKEMCGEVVLSFV